MPQIHNADGPQWSRGVPPRVQEFAAGMNCEEPAKIMSDIAQPPTVVESRNASNVMPYTAPRTAALTARGRYIGSSRARSFLPQIS
jgi:hypothetical protein